jgi:EAL and modified HD-GYP domain-containing signal transduction protein
MGSPVSTAQNEKFALESPEGRRYVARQPILDLRGHVHGYELLFRKGHEPAFCGDVETASRTMLDNAVMFGHEWLTGDLPAFFNCTAEVLTTELAGVLPPETTVLEILETVEPTPEVVAACQKLRAQGFRLALDDFIWDPKFAPLIAVADYIKVDFQRSNAEERQKLLQQIRGRAIKLVAEKVESPEEYRQACAEGFTLFQGYYFCRPVLMEKHKIPANTIFHLEILKLLHRDPMDIDRLCELVKSDTSITYRLLRLVNSPVYAIRQEIRSIHAAIVMVGEDTFRRIATLAITSEMNAHRPAEILRMALVRAEFCELSAGLCDLDATEQYLLGMLSMLPAMLQVPMEAVAPSLPLRAEICEALMGAANTERGPLSWIEAQERGDWDACDAIVEAAGLHCEELYECYSEAVPWAEAALRAVA